MTFLELLVAAEERIGRPLTDDEIEAAGRLVGSKAALDTLVDLCSTRPADPGDNVAVNRYEAARVQIPGRKRPVPTVVKVEDPNE